MKYKLLGFLQWVAPHDTIQHLASRLSDKTCVFELGCRRGSLLHGLREVSWMGFYCGVGISTQAMNDGHKSADQRSSWIVSGIESFRSPFK